MIVDLATERALRDAEAALRESADFEPTAEDVREYAVTRLVDEMQGAGLERVRELNATLGSLLAFTN